MQQQDLNEQQQKDVLAHLESLNLGGGAINLQSSVKGVRAGGAKHHSFMPTSNIRRISLFGGGANLNPSKAPVEAPVT